MIVLIFFISLWYLSLFSQTFFLHRYASHRAFTMSPFWERVFYVFSYLTMGTSYLSPRAYASMHRMHHAFTDNEIDPVYFIIRVFHKLRIIKLIRQPVSI